MNKADSMIRMRLTTVRFTARRVLLTQEAHRGVQFTMARRVVGPESVEGLSSTLRHNAESRAPQMLQFSHLQPETPYGFLLASCH